MEPISDIKSFNSIDSNGRTMIPITITGRCDAIGIWVDYELISSRVHGDKFPHITLNNYRPMDSNDSYDFPLHYNVNLKFMKEPVSVAANQNILLASAKFSVGDSDVDFNFDILSN